MHPLLTALALALLVPVSPAAQVVLRASAVAGGGGRLTGGAYAAVVTLGQPAAGRAAGGAFAVGAGFAHALLVGPSGAVAVAAQVLLEGPFLPEAGAMRTDLLTAGLLPLAHPYGGPPWNHAGAEALPAVPDGVVDWVLLELRPTPAAAPAARRAALLVEDGAVVDLDGSSPVVFTGLAPGSYHLVVHHRNQLRAMTATAAAFPGGPTAVDLTASAGYGDGQVEVAAGFWALPSGDVDADGDVDGADEAAWRGSNGGSGYLGGDVTLDGASTAGDLQEGVRPNAGRTSPVPMPRRAEGAPATERTAPPTTLPRRDARDE
jgi:hypothetical protein